MLYNYFIHPSNLSKMDAVLKMRMTLGAAGYGVYMQLLELLRDAPNYTALFDAPVLAWALHEPDAGLVERVVTEFGLFDVASDNSFRSPWLCAAMAEHDERRAKYAAAGRKSAAVRASKTDQSATSPEQGSNDVQTTLPPPLGGGSNDVATVGQQKKETKTKSLKNKKPQPTKEGEGMGDLFEEDLIITLERTACPPWDNAKDGHLLRADDAHNPAPLSRIAEKYHLNRNQVLHLWRCCRECEIGSAPFMALLAAAKNCEETRFTPNHPFSYFVSRIKPSEP